MNETKYYLRPNVQLEPMVNSWHAYPFLINPATLAMVTLNYHMATMNSYVKMPMAHAAALKNPDMIGGAFIDYEGQRVEEIKSLKEMIALSSQDLIGFAQEIKALLHLLKTKAKGYPLSEIYDEVPANVKGYVELFYDIDNQPSFRFFEPLLYRSQYHKQELQSIALKAIDTDHRPFIFSTPRLKDENTLHLNIPFNDKKLDWLSELKFLPDSFKNITNKLELEENKFELLKSLLIEEKKLEKESFEGNGVRIRYFGHACVLFETKNTNILVDPLISYKYPTNIKRYTYDDLPEVIDYVLITHNHHDHIVIETLLQLRKKIGCVIVPRSDSGSLLDPSMKYILNAIGFDNVVELDDLESLVKENVTIIGIPFFGEHCDLAIRSKSSYLLKFENTSFLMCADSSCLNEEVYKNVRQCVGKIDHLFLGLECTGAPMSWAYGPLFPFPIEKKLDLVRRSNGSDATMAWELINIFDVKHVYLYAMGAEPWLNYIMALQHDHSDASQNESLMLIEKCKSHGIFAEKLFGSMEMVVDQQLEHMSL